MAILKASNSGAHIYLKPVHLFGRDPGSADTVLKHDACSRLHCVLRWQAGQCFITDESKNGCYVNGNRIEPRRSLRLREGDLFATSQDDGEQWVLTSDEAPQPVIITSDGSEFRELNSLNLLPSELTPECQIVQRGKQWYFEKGHNTVEIREGFGFSMEQKHWFFYPNDLLTETDLHTELEQAQPELIFEVSRDQEHVAMTLIVDDAHFDFGYKTHHCLLMEIARHRMQDSSRSHQDCGWMSIDLLLRTLGIDINYLNIQIYRARSAIKKCSEYWGQNLLERRRSEIRLHNCKLTLR